MLTVVNVDSILNSLTSMLCCRFADHHRINSTFYFPMLMVTRWYHASHLCSMKGHIIYVGKKMCIIYVRTYTDTIYETVGTVRGNPV